MEQLEDILGGLIIISGAVLIVYFISRYTYLTKKMLAEKGALSPKSERSISKMDIAYVVIGIGVGLLISAGLSLLELSEDTMDLLSWGIVLIMGAVGLLVASQQKKQPLE
ncbi:MAG: hypothetical protein AAF388_25890 [Bacteroidota bacterium]